MLQCLEFPNKPPRSNFNHCTDNKTDRQVFKVETASRARMLCPAPHSISPFPTNTLDEKLRFSKESAQTLRGKSECIKTIPLSDFRRKSSVISPI